MASSSERHLRNFAAHESPLLQQALSLMDDCRISKIRDSPSSSQSATSSSYTAPVRSHSDNAAMCASSSSPTSSSPNCIGDSNSMNGIIGSSSSNGAGAQGFGLCLGLRSGLRRASSAAKQKAQVLAKSTRSKISLLVKRALTINGQEVREIELPPLPAGLPGMSCGSYDCPNDPTAASTPIGLLPDDLLLDCLARLDRRALGPAMRVCQTWRSVIRSETFREYREHLGLMESRLFVLSSTVSSQLVLQVFRPEKNSWSSASLPDTPLAVDDLSQVCAINQSIYLLSGVLSKGRAPVVYHPWTHSLDVIRGMRTPRYRVVCGEVEGQLYVVGGLKPRVPNEELDNEGGGRDIRWGEVFSAEDDFWEEIPSMRKERCGAVGGCVNGKVYVIGGCKNNEQFRENSTRDSMEIFDPSSQTWEIRKQIPKLGLMLGSAIFRNSIFILRNEGNKVSWIKYSTKKDKWKNMHDVPRLPSDPLLSNNVAFQCVSGRNRIYLVQVRGCYRDINPQAAGQKDLPIVLVYNPKGEGADAFRRAQDVPMVTSGAVSVMIRC